MSIEPDTKRALHLKILSSAKRIESWNLARQCALMDNTSNKYVLYLRNEGHTILTEYEKGCKNCWYVYVSGPTVSIKQVETPCPKCGSYYRLGNDCNICKKEEK